MRYEDEYVEAGYLYDVSFLDEFDVVNDDDDEDDYNFFRSVSL